LQNILINTNKQQTSGTRKLETILDFNEVRDDGVALASAGPYAKHLHLVPNR